MEFWKYYSILKRRWLLILAISLVVAAAVGYSQWSKPTEYEVSAQLKELPAVAEGSTLIYQTQLSMGAESLLRMGNLQRLIKSDAVIKDLWDEIITDGPVRFREVLNTEREPIVTLSSWFNVDLAPNSQFVIITAKGETQEESLWLSQAIIRGVMQRYNAINLESIRTDRARLQNELIPVAEAQLKDRRQKLAAYKAQTNIDGDPATVSQAIIQRASQYQNDFDKAVVAMKEADARKKSAESVLQRSYAKNEYIDLQNVMAANPVIQQITSDILRAEGELARQQEVKADKHPDIIALKSQIANLRKSIASESQDILNSQTKGRNPIRDAAVSTMINAELDYASAAKRQASLKSPLATVTSQMKKLPEVERKMAELQLAVQVLATHQCRESGSGGGQCGILQEGAA